MTAPTRALRLILVAFVACFALPQAVTAQEEAAPSTSERIELATNQAKQEQAAQQEAASVSLRDVLRDGGFMMYPLAALSFIAVLLIIFYTLTIRQGAVVSDQFMDEAESMIRKQDYLGLIAYCNRSNEAVARVTQKTLDFATRNPKARFNEVRELAEAEGSRQASLMGQRISYLMDVGSVAPMVGLLGTVLGMIKSFNEIGSSTFAGAKQVELAGGVSEALITTASGLVIGIPALIFYSIFKGRVAKLISELEAASTHIVALLAVQYSDARERAAEWAPEQHGVAIRSTATRRSQSQEEFPQGQPDEPRGI